MVDFHKYSKLLFEYQLKALPFQLLPITPVHFTFTSILLPGLLACLSLPGSIRPPAVVALCAGALVAMPIANRCLLRLPLLVQLCPTLSRACTPSAHSATSGFWWLAEWESRPPPAAQRTGLSDWWSRARGRLGPACSQVRHCSSGRGSGAWGGTTGQTSETSPSLVRRRRVCPRGRTTGGGQRRRASAAGDWSGTT